MLRGSPQRSATAELSRIWAWLSTDLPNLVLLVFSSSSDLVTLDIIVCISSGPLPIQIFNARGAPVCPYRSRYWALTSWPVSSSLRSTRRSAYFVAARSLRYPPPWCFGNFCDGLWFDVRDCGVSIGHDGDGECSDFSDFSLQATKGQTSAQPVHRFLALGPHIK